MNEQDLLDLIASLVGSQSIQSHDIVDTIMS